MDFYYINTDGFLSIEFDCFAVSSFSSFGSYPAKTQKMSRFMMDSSFPYSESSSDFVSTKSKRLSKHANSLLICLE